MDFDINIEKILIVFYIKSFMNLILLEYQIHYNLNNFKTLS